MYVQSHNRIQMFGRHGWPKVSLQPAHGWERPFSSSRAHGYNKDTVLLIASAKHVTTECSHGIQTFRNITHVIAVDFSSTTNLSYRKQYALLRSTGVRLGGPWVHGAAQPRELAEFWLLVIVSYFVYRILSATEFIAKDGYYRLNTIHVSLHPFKDLFSRTTWVSRY